MSRSWVWGHFENLSNGFAACQQCGKRIARSGFSTSGLIKHLGTHNIHEFSKRPRPAEADPDPEEGTGEPSSSSSSSLTQPSKVIKIEGKQQSIRQFVKRQTLGEIFAKCSARDGFSIAGITKSEAIRGYVCSMKYEMPKSETTVWKRIEEFYQEKLENFIMDIGQQKESRKKWSVLIDEWTDIKNLRYLNISLHDGQKSQQALLIPIPAGSCTSERVLELMESSFAQLGINFKSDICASTNDGASVMKKYGGLIPVEAQLCLNHAIHLAVVGVLYKTNKKKKSDKTTVVDDNQEAEGNKNV